LIERLDSARAERKDQNVADALKAQPPFYEKYLKQEGEDKSVPVQLKWEAMPIADVLSILSSKEFLEFNYLLSPEVKGTVTMSLDKRMSRRELWQFFEQTLLTCGACCVPEDSLIKIIPIARMAKEPRVDIQNASVSNIYLAFIHIRNNPVRDVIEKMKPSLTAGTIVIVLPLSNEILLVETPSNAARLLPMIESLDKAPADAKKVDHGQ